MRTALASPWVLATSLTRRNPSAIARFSVGFGSAIQAVVHWSTREILVADGNAALMWSTLNPRVAGPVERARRLVQAARALLLGVAVGLPLFVLTSMALVVPTVVAGWALGARGTTVRLVAFSAVSARLVMITASAIREFSLETRRSKSMVVHEGPVWRLDVIGSADPGHGHGTKLMRRFIDLANDAGVDVYLVTVEANAPFYSKFGFRAVQGYDARPFHGHVLMFRRPWRGRRAIRRRGQRHHAVQQPAGAPRTNRA